jgi:hypothetical protein
MKYAILMSLVGAVAFAAVGCSDDPKTGDTTGSGGSEASSSSSSSGSAGAGGAMASSSSSSSGAGGGGGAGGGAGGAGGGAGGAGGGAGGAGGGGGGAGGGAMVCDNSEVVDKDDPAMRCQMGVPTQVVNVVMAPPAMVWADKINAFSSEYGPGFYGSGQAKAAPDVYPDSGDEQKAWATMTPDGMNEFITVGYTTPVVAESVWVYETFNPGAISKITITAADGDHIVYMNANAQSLGICSHILSVSTKTCSPISAVRIDLASEKVGGYNEIDAVGLLPPK